MRKNTLIYKYRIFVVLLLLIVLGSCNQSTQITKEFVWDKNVKELTGGNLYNWLKKAPFDNEVNRGGDGVLVITNSRQVFPFKGRYYNAIEEVGRYDSNDTVIFRKSEILFRDSLWGDLFLHATLLYEDQEVFLSDSYFEVGNPIFGGVEAVGDMHRSSLYETSVLAKHPNYKTGIYWVSANYQEYLLGFYQQGQLVFQSVVPFRGDTLTTLDKLKEVNQSLGLHIAEWENAKVSDLQKVDQPKSFWQDPFFGIYPSKFGNDVFLKTKDTPFVKDDKPRQGDYYFSYQSSDGDVFFYTSMQPTELNKEDFNKGNKKMAKYHYSHNDIFYEEHRESGYVSGLAKTYFMGNQYMEIHFGYPETDGKAKKQIHEVLKYIKMLNYEGTN